MSEPVVVAPAPPRLDVEAATLMRELSRAAAELLERLPGRLARAVDVERALGVNKKLAWQIFRIARSEDLGDIANVPSAVAMRSLMAAARKRRVPADVLDRVVGAFERFDAFASEQADDRAGLVTLVGGFAGASGETFDVGLRKGAFRANAHIWGVQCRLQVRTFIAHEALNEPGQEETLLVAADVGLQRLHPGKSLTVSMWYRQDTHARGEEAGDGAKHLAVPVSTVEILPEFCTQPLPPMTPQPSVNGKIDAEMIIPPGRAGALNLCSTVGARAPERIRVTGDPVMVLICIPSEELVVDVVSPVGWTDPATGRAAIYGRRHHPEHAVEERTIDLLPQQANVKYLGALQDLPPVPGAPRHHEAVRQMLERRGWLGTKFDVHRCRVQYPALHTVLSVRVDPAGR